MTTTVTAYTAASAVVDGAKTVLVLVYPGAQSRGPTNLLVSDCGGQTLVPGVDNVERPLGFTGILTTAGESSIMSPHGASACHE